MLVIVTIALFAVCAFLRLREMGISPIHELTCLIRHPWFETLLLSIFVGGLIQFGSTKGTNGLGNPMPQMMASAPLITPVAVDVASFNFPTNFPTITNLCFWGLEATSNAVELGIAWPAHSSFTNGCLDLFGQSALAPTGWRPLARIDVSAIASNVIIELERDFLLSNALDQAGFFQLANQDDRDGDGLSDACENLVVGTYPDAADSDGDGMPDGWEVSYGLNPLVVDAESDLDEDGLSNCEECRLGTDPTEMTAAYVEALPAGANANAYYHLNFSVESAAHVKFAGDRPSNLPDPEFYARAGVTNSVLLLIGKPYRVESSEPMELIGSSIDNTRVTILSGYQWLVVCPISFEYVSSFGANLLGFPPTGRQTAIFVAPTNLEGAFSVSSNFCCVAMSESSMIRFGCGSGCSCGGCSSGMIGYSYEGWSTNIAGVTCSCAHHGPNEDLEQEGRTVGSAGVTLSAPAVIFEDEYETAPGNVEHRRSTELTVTYVVNGGPNGGDYAFSANTGDRLVRTGGTLLQFSGTATANEHFSRTLVYEAQGPSAAEGDISFSASFTDALTGVTTNTSVTLTAIQVSFWPENSAPENQCMYRHKVGVCEVMHCKQSPLSPSVEWAPREGCMSNALDGVFYHCSLSASYNPLKVRIPGTGLEYVPQIEVVEPNDVATLNARVCCAEAISNEAGMVSLVQDYYVLPLDVSFANISMEEVPSTAGSCDGYFSISGMGDLSHHSRQNGAGNWFEVNDENMFGVDRAGFSRLRRVREVAGIYELIEDGAGQYGWINGRFSWEIPFGWNIKGTSGEADAYRQFFAHLKLQEGVIFEDGTCGCRKFGHAVLRKITGEVWLDFVRVQ